MNSIPPKLRVQLASDLYMGVCARRNAECEGRITWEHAWLYAGKQIQEAWAIIPLCEHHHLGTGLHKPTNQLIALNRATPEELKKYPNVDWEKERKRLTAIVKAKNDLP